MKVLYLVSVLAMTLTVHPVYADWGQMLEDLEKAGKSMLDQDTQPNELGENEIISGLREALETGSRRAIEQVGQPGGYLNNPKIRIPLPPRVQQASDLMQKFGMGQLANDFENSINSAAERAAPQAMTLMVDAIKSMSIEDAKNILHGNNDAATRFFEKKTRPQLASLFAPVIDDSLQEVGATRYYNQMDEQMSSLPLVGESLNLDLNEYVTQQALNGLFIMLSEEEQKIRTNPAARTSEILQQVFGEK